MNTASNKDAKVASTAVRTLLLLGAFGIGVLVALVVGMFGGWPIAMVLLAGVGVLVLMIFIWKSVIEANHLSGSDTTLPFTYMPVYRVLYSVTKPRESGRNGEQESFVPFAFKDKE
ncbi:MAG: hypothetical protein M3Y39_06820 [Chloroflexota bacterium]|nr:hypothetical protein [Chloroflexota bacterium]